MRIWDVAPRRLCRAHLLGEHRELHGLWNVLTVHRGRGGYSRHPETLRWRGRLAALYRRHGALADEMARRGYRHLTPLDRRRATGNRRQTVLIHALAEQRRILARKGCACFGRRPRRAA